MSQLLYVCGSDVDNHPSHNCLNENSLRVKSGKGKPQMPVIPLLPRCQLPQVAETNPPQIHDVSGEGSSYDECTVRICLVVANVKESME